MQKNELLKKLRSAGNDERIVKGFELVERADFVQPEFRPFAYEDRALPIGFSQTISQPSTIAFMLAKLDPQKKQKILEVGSGSGYVLALLHAIVPEAKIFGTERVRGLYEHSLKIIFPFSNVKVCHTPEKLGLPEEAPFDRILVSASAESLPQELVDQLADGGVMVCPVKNSILMVRKTKDKIKTEEYPGFMFVPLL